MSEPFIGEIRMFPYNFPPRGWAYCNGQLMSIPQYTALFAVIGTYYGGNGSTTFALPNLMGRVPINQGQGPGLPDIWQIGEPTGSDTVTLNSLQIPSHNHGAQILGSAIGTTNQPADQLSAVAGSDVAELLYKRDATNFTPMAGPAILAAGGNQAHENMQPYLALSFCIAIEGIFPARN